MPDGTNVVFSYYLNWIYQFVGTIAYYTMLCTIALLFIGMCIYIGGMVEDLKLTISELDAGSDTFANQLSSEIAFHIQVLE